MERLLAEDLKVLAKAFYDVPAYEAWKKALMQRIEDVRVFTHKLLKHDADPFEGMRKPIDLEGLYVLDGYEVSYDGAIGIVSFPTPDIETIGDDMLGQISIIFFFMVKYQISRVDLTDDTGDLRMSVTEFAADGGLSSPEKSALSEIESTIADVAIQPLIVSF